MRDAIIETSSQTKFVFFLRLKPFLARREANLLVEVNRFSIIIPIENNDT